MNFFFSVGTRPLYSCWCGSLNYRVFKKPCLVYSKVKESRLLKNLATHDKSKPSKASLWRQILANKRLFLMVFILFKLF